MRAGIVVNVSRADRRRLEAIVADRSSPQKHVWRAQIILATADGCGTSEIMRRSGKAKPVVWRWQDRFMLEKPIFAFLALAEEKSLTAAIEYEDSRMTRFRSCRRARRTIPRVYKCSYC
jgi:hypothetical protein